MVCLIWYEEREANSENNNMGVSQTWDVDSGTQTEKQLKQSNELNNSKNK